MDLLLAREILDQEIIDRQGTNMGRVDGLVLTIDGDGPPRIDHFELGFVVLARRVHPRLETWLQAIRKRWSVRKSARQIIKWSEVTEIKSDHIAVDIDALHTPAFDWERWLRKHVISRLPGSGGEE
jgi:sporulation protein YlmC with PRC-barrel domain